jgi:filamentous hemagglutinin
MNPGPLPDHMAETFSGGKYTTVVTDAPITLYRAGVLADPPSASWGQYFSEDIPISEVQTRVDKAVLPTWRTGDASPIEVVFNVELPAGTTLHIGEVGSQGGIYNGGTGQIVVVKPWDIPGGKIVEHHPIVRNQRQRHYEN